MQFKTIARQVSGIIKKVETFENKSDKIAFITLDEGQDNWGNPLKGKYSRVPVFIKENLEEYVGKPIEITDIKKIEHLLFKRRKLVQHVYIPDIKSVLIEDLKGKTSEKYSSGFYSEELPLLRARVLEKLYKWKTKD